MDYFDYNSIKPDPDFDVERFLEQSQQQEQERLEEELERIEQQLEKRDRLYEEAINELESKLDWYLERLETLYKRMTGKQGERDEVKTRIKEFYREIRNEKRQHWHDQQELEKERREILWELDEIEDEDLLSSLL